MALFGVGLDVNQKRINTEFKLFLSKNQNSQSIRHLKKLFQQQDKQQTNKVDHEEFVKCLNNFGFFLKKVDYQALIKYYDRSNEGRIDYNDYLNTILEPLNQSRLKAVSQTFNEVDIDKDGQISFQEFEQAFNLQSNQSYVQGRKSKAEVLNELFQLFDEDKDGTITKQEFELFYTELSVGIPADNQFINLLKLQWGVKEEVEQKQVDSKLLKDVINTLRYRLIQMTNGTHEDFLLRKIFNEFDVNRNGTLNLDELYAMTIKLNCPIDRVYLQAFLEKFDKNNNGFIEYQEFVSFLLMDPYK